MAPTSEKWKHFERLVAAIHSAADRGAEVQWNEKIQGRQFDVTIRFRKGLYRYLTVVECKDYVKAVPVEQVEAFVTKSSDVQAQYAVMASTSGFQEGARNVASRHNLALIHVTESSETDLSSFGARWAGTTDALHIQSVELEYVDGTRKPLPIEANRLTYYIKQILIQDSLRRTTLDAMIREDSGQYLGGEIDVYRNHVRKCRSGARVVAPDDGEIPLRELACIHVRAGITKARLITGPYMFDPYLLVPQIKVRNLGTHEETDFNPHSLRLGVNTEFVQGNFYEQPPVASFFYCDCIKDGVARLFLVESFQLGRLFQAELTVKTEHADFYVPVSDSSTIQRLQRRLELLKARLTKR